MRRRDLLLVPAVTAASAFPARARNYPERPITLITGYAPGGSTDIAARIWGRRRASWSITAPAPPARSRRNG